MDKPCIYVAVNKSLNMSAGKLAAQVGHAVALCMAQTDQPFAEWFEAPHRWLIVLAAQDGEQLYYLHEYLWERGMQKSYRVIDEGVNEIPPFSITALGVGPVEKDSEEARFMSGLPKYQHADDDGMCIECGWPRRVTRRPVGI